LFFFAGGAANPAIGFRHRIERHLQWCAAGVNMGNACSFNGVVISMTSRLSAAQLRSSRLRHVLLSSAVLMIAAVPAAYALSGDTGAQARAGDVRFDVPPQELDTALTRVADQGGVGIFFTSAELSGIQSSGVSGAMTVEQALSQVLNGTGFGWRYREAGTVLIEKLPDTRGALLLGPLRVEGEIPSTSLSITSDPNATEGSGSYSVRSASAATRMDLSLRETPQSISVITRQQIEDQNLLTLDAVLRQTPGIVADRLDERVSFASRGFTLGTMLNGIPTLAFNSAAGEFSMASTAIYDRIEVIRGAAGLLNGVGDPGGAINLIRKRPTTEFSGQVSTGIGSWNRYTLTADVGGPLNSAGTIRARAVASQVAGDSFIAAKDRAESVFYGIVEADITPDTLFAIGYEHQTTAIDGSNFGQNPLYYSDGSRTNLPRSFSSAAPWSYWNMYSDTVFLNLKHDFGNDWQLQLETRHLKNRRAARFGYLFNYLPIDAETGDATIEIRDNPVRATNNSVDAFIKGPFEAFGGQHQAVFGVSYNHYDYRVDINSVNATGWDRRDFNFYELSTYPEPADSDFNKLWTQPGKVTEKAVYGSTRLQLAESLNLTLGGRLTWYDETSSFYIWPSDETIIYPSAKEHAIFTPYAGLVLDLNQNISAYASFTDIFRPNTVRDSNNVLLDPQRGKNYELGLKGEFLDERLNLAVAIFRTRQNNLAVEDTDGGTLPDGSTPYKAIAGARSNGYEFTMAGELLPGLQLSGGFTHHTQRDADGALLNPNYPRNIFRLATSYTLPGALNKLTIGGNISYQGGIYYDEVDGYGRVTQGGVTLIGLNAQYDVTEQFSLSGNIENLTDRKYYSGLGGYNGYIYGDPRNFWIRARYRF
jgi:iron complex outermembrane receptor protein/outer membrane receptor for ferric coprogen and ferric-rhodotorulic acid